jgi:hypothetical protein
VVLLVPAWWLILERQFGDMSRQNRFINIRPAKGLEPKHYQELLGKRLKVLSSAEWQLTGIFLKIKTFLSQLRGVDDGLLGSDEVAVLHFTDGGIFMPALRTMARDPVPLNPYKIDCMTTSGLQTWSASGIWYLASDEHGDLGIRPDDRL